MSKDQVLNSETSAPPEKPKDQDIPGNQKITLPHIVVTANGLKVKSNLNPNASEFYPTWILPKVDKGEGNVNIVVKEKFSIETLEEEIKTTCHYEIIHEIVNKNDSLVEIIEQPEKGLQMLTNVVGEEIIERRFSENFEKSSILLKESDEEEIESIKCEMIAKCEEIDNCKENKEELRSNCEKTFKSKEVLLNCRAEESIRKKIQNEVNIDPQVLFFGPATETELEISTQIESVEEVSEDLKKFEAKYQENAIIEDTVVGDHTEANIVSQISKVCESQTKNKILDDVATTSTTKINQKLTTSDEKKLKYNNSSRIAISGTLKGLTRTMTSTGTVKKLLSSTSPTKDTKVVLSTPTARSCLATPRSFQSSSEAKKNETPKNVMPSSSLSKMSTNTKKTIVQSKSSVISSNIFIKKDVLIKSKTKDSISLRSTCSTDKSSLSNKSSSLSSTSKFLSAKIVEKPISKASSRPMEKAGVKRTDYLTRSPGGTVSSNLRKTETQKRQNLFPDSDAIKMTDILFK